MRAPRAKNQVMDVVYVDRHVEHCPAVCSWLSPHRPLLIAGVVPAAMEADSECDDLDQSSFNVVVGHGP